jgi:hypothetical protein
VDSNWCCERGKGAPFKNFAVERAIYAEILKRLDRIWEPVE